MTDQPIVREIGERPVDACVIWLHGLGADGHDFEPIVPELRLGPELAVRFVFPHAPMMPVTINQGFVMRAWYDIRTTDIGADPDEQGIRASADKVEQMIAEQIDGGINPGRVVLAGFSQGGAIALHAGLRQSHQLGGIMALSTYLLLASTLEAEHSAASKLTPVFMAHGSIDPVIPIGLANSTRDVLETLGYTVEWHEYRDMPHSVSAAEITHISSWLERILC